METLAALAQRRSVRGYLAKTVEKEKLAAVVAAGQQAPKAGPFHLTVIRDAELLRQIDGATLAAMKASGNEFMMGRAALPGYRPLYGAPALVVVSAPAGPFARDCAACAAAAERQGDSDGRFCIFLESKGMRSNGLKYNGLSR